MKKQSESGFILVTSLVLLSIVTLIGTTAAFKSVIETKVSRMSGAGSQAFMVANAGLQKQFIEWGMDNAANSGDGDQSEFGKLLMDIRDKTVTSGMYNITVTPTGVDDLRVNHANNDIDAWVQGASNVRVFELTSTGIIKVANNTWNIAATKGVQQVAVWATSFVTPAADTDYPYATPNAGACSACSLVVYALGRFDSSYRMARQTMSSAGGPGKLKGASAMTNAPAGGDFANLCNSATGSTTANGTPWHNATTGVGTKNGGNGTALIEATQAEYVTGVNPSGTALASNVALGEGGKGFRKGQSSKTGPNFSSTPYVIYSGHGTKSSYKVDWADEDLDQAGTELPAGKIPQDLIKSPLLGTNDEVKYFSSDNGQLFTMDAYRWGAEQFTCQDTTKADGQYGNGAYCSKAEALRLALDKQMGGDGTGSVVRGPVTGRLTIAQIQYNIANAIPMFGLVRLMFPAVVDTNKNEDTSTCHGKTVVNHVIEGKNGEKSQWGDAFDKFTYKGGTYTGSLSAPVAGKFPFTRADGAVADGDSDLGPNGRLMVYGTLLIDYFADYDIEGEGAAASFAYNTVYDPLQGERLLEPLESVDVYLAVEYNMMINPVMPKFGVNTPIAFATAAGAAVPAATPAVTPSVIKNSAGLAAAATQALTTAGRINMHDTSSTTTKVINLASPYDGVFPWSEGMMPRPVGESDAGVMRMMRLGNASGLLAGSVANIGTEVTTLNAKFTALLNTAKPFGSGTDAKLVRYYYELMVATIEHADTNKTPGDNIWPVAPWPGDTLSADFYIGKEDGAAATNHMGDKLHLMFPSGYAHAWKVALASLNITADEWNHILSGSENAGEAQGIADAEGLYDQIKNKCSAKGLVVGVGCASGYPYNLEAATSGYNSFVSKSDVQTIQDDEAVSYYITPDAKTGYGLLDADWKDLPSTMYSGGLLDMHAHSNMNGIIYTPGPLEWEPGNSKYDSGKNNGHLSYISGSIITGFGASINNVKGNENSHLILVFDPLTVDNVPVDTGGDSTIILRRYAWQGLR